GRLGSRRYRGARACEGPRGPMRATTGTARRAVAPVEAGRRGGGRPFRGVPRSVGRCPGTGGSGGSARQRSGAYLPAEIASGQVVRPDVPGSVRPSVVAVNPPRQRRLGAARTCAHSFSISTGR